MASDTGLHAAQISTTQRDVATFPQVSTTAGWPVDYPTDMGVLRTVGDDGYSVISDQCFPPILLAGGGKCVAVVLVEDGRAFSNIFSDHLVLRVDFPWVLSSSSAPSPTLVVMGWTAILLIW